MQEGEAADIVCESVGSRPEVDLLWSHRKEGGSFIDITNDATEVDSVNPGDDARSDAVSTLKYTARRDFNGGELRCLTPERDLVAEMNDFAILKVLCKFGKIPVFR